jgi:uncharacterized membrane protein YhaH (DUF805 family)
MDNTFPQQTPIQSSRLNTTTPGASSHFNRLFTGRLNRSGFLIGGIAVVFGMAIIAMILFTLIALIFPSLANVAGSFLILLILVVTTFYGWSFGLRRLHDVNRTGKWLYLYVPGFLLTFLSLNPLSTLLIHVMSAIPSPVLFVFTVFRWLTNILGLYLLFWPGTQVANKYGLPSTHWKVKEILGLI